MNGSIDFLGGGGDRCIGGQENELVLVLSGYGEHVGNRWVCPGMGEETGRTFFRFLVPYIHPRFFLCWPIGQSLIGFVHGPNA